MPWYWCLLSQLGCGDVPVACGCACVQMGTLTPDIVRAVKEMRAGRLEFRVSPKPILQMVIGKVRLLI